MLSRVVLSAHFIAAVAAVAQTPSCDAFSPSLYEFGSEFHQPAAPLVKSKFEVSFVQHKWDQTLSHVTAGYILNNPDTGVVRVDEAYDGNVASSIFNYANVTKDGLVDNTLTTFVGKTPGVFRDYVNSNYPIFTQDFLVKSGAVFGGLVKRQFTHGLVASWKIMYENQIPVTIYVTNCNVIVGFDYFLPQARTRVITEFFNIKAQD